jgi:hypothetical protein
MMHRRDAGCSSSEGEEKRRDLLGRLNEIDGIRLSPDSITLRPSIPIPALSAGTRLDSFLQVMSRLVEQLTAG